jgi:hypothetical protein
MRDVVFKADVGDEVLLVNIAITTKFSADIL